MNPNILIIIPARGGSKGIPRKNLRPLNGMPLIYYSIKTALQSQFNPDVYVTTDDEEIKFFAEKYGAKVHLRSSNLASDKITLDPVVYSAYQFVEINTGKKYDYIITLQPTSPLLQTESLDDALKSIINNPTIETVISAVNDTHLTWGKSKDEFKPLYEKRVNRQQLPEVFKETGGFFISHYSVVEENNRIGEKVSLYQLSASESIDIDSFEDWALCEYYLRRKLIVFNVSGYSEIGLGHVYNCLILANEILDHRVKFVVDRRSKLAFEKISQNNYEVIIQGEELLEETIEKLNPDVVINDRLDTSSEFMSNLKDKGYKLINIEDLGQGTNYADVVINAIYPEKEILANHYYGPSYFCARDEFLIQENRSINSSVKEVLITFGGVDPNDLTFKVLSAIYEYCTQNNIKINVVLGLGYLSSKKLSVFKNINIYKNLKSMSDMMRLADIAFSSAGRTVYELALIGTPSIILAQNSRELTHLFASTENGFINLGLGKENSEKEILNTFIGIVENLESRQEMHKRMVSNDIRNGKKRVIDLINNVINN